ncbi:MAG: NlpC/P60 family protein [Acidimicrobiales bacterium]
MRPATGRLIAEAAKGLVVAPGAPGRRRRRAASLLISAMLLAGVGTPLVLAGAPAGADQVATLQERAQYIAAEIQAANVKLTILDESYLQAKARVASLAQQVAAATKAIGSAEQALAGDQSHLREVAIEAYVTGGESQSLSVVFNGTQQTAGMQQAYIQAASGNLDESETTVEINQRALTIDRTALDNSERLARDNETSITTDLAQAQALTAQLNTEEANVKGQLAAAVAAAERAKAAAYAAQLAAAARAAEASAQQQQQTVTPPPPVTPSSPSLPPVAGDTAGQIAVNAAQSQRGVPYVWGGATPGAGFDCSGLTMWAWSQAGVSLAHGATEQYYETEHVSMADLQPGDLIFYGDAYLLYHVVMYIVDGMVVQAEETGTNVMDTPIPPGAYGAGRP